ncbi:ATP synthase F1 subunit epsilon [Rickettsiales bacterium]|nr:ATP synthase F1 subunit epsilon [Rickettsiales bacterium]
MSGHVNVELVTPEKLFFSSEVGFVEVPGIEGDFGVLPDHAPLISLLRPGLVIIEESASKNRSIFVSGGFVEVTKERCTVLAKEAIDIADISEKVAQARFDSALKAVEKSKDKDNNKAKEELEISQALLNCVKTSH